MQTTGNRLNTSSWVKNTLKKLGITPQKLMGQNFMFEHNSLNRVTEAAELSTDDIVIEIGAGLGHLTRELAKKVKKVIAVEMDRRLGSALHATLSDDSSIKVVIGDARKLNLASLAQRGKRPYKVVSNLPYSSATIIIRHILESKDKPDIIVTTIQKEVAERICHDPGSKKYGILSVLTQLFYKTKYLFSVNPSVFDPQPKIKSGVIELTRKKIFKLNCNENQLFKIIKLSFQQRRKTLRNSLKILDIPSFLREDTIFDKRPEELSGKEFVEITKKISNVNS